ncbi:glycosyltransferase involved in cell wall biosynthesis [Desulfobaculum xiamenense]|uniref:Glycosyltransferase involved in cell wall biosynthesis n=1 Tax=Desulfobaculum xiamenense TaxID=995050 RepID=A0A846QVK4_9BACT|nr:glycosyltransferase [Desulfobaculum xiamenense]NJB68669.1 glycosyltransferase involved in cell wall biosynthesis [Desulfobaculum xiamenense]
MSAPLVIHDAFRFPGGGERVATHVAKRFGARIVTSHMEHSAFPAGYFDGLDITDLDALRRSPIKARLSRTLTLGNAFAHMPQTSAPWTLFSGTICPLAHARVDGRRILYCHTPPRMLYDLHEATLAALPPWQRPWLRLVTRIFRSAYERAMAEMDVVIANSATVQERLRRYLGIESEIIHPPCPTQSFRFIAQDGFYLSCARLDPLKRVDVIVRAFASMPERRLVVTSGGPQLPALKALAQGAPNIEFTGFVGERRLQELVGSCIAAIYIPRDEDFGMSPVECMAAGKPVIGVNEGGLRETVVHGKTGLLLPPSPAPDDVVRAVDALAPAQALAMRDSCERRASRFSTAAFDERLHVLTAAHAR